MMRCWLNMTSAIMVGLCIAFMVLVPAVAGVVTPEPAPIEGLSGVKARLAQLSARHELKAQMERIAAERKAVRAEMASVKDELDALHVVHASVSVGSNPTVSLPDELISTTVLPVPQVQRCPVGSTRCENFP